MINEEFEKIIALLEKTDMNNYSVIEPLWEKEIELFTKDINATIDFVKTECTATQFSWMSEIWDEITEKTQSKDFIEAIKETAKKFPEECEKYNIQSSIESAEGYLK